MSTEDSQILFMVLVLPSFFGLTLIGEGLNKVMKDKSAKTGWASMIIGGIFIVVVLIAYVKISGISSN